MSTPTAPSRHPRVYDMIAVAFVAALLISNVAAT